MSKKGKGTRSSHVRKLVHPDIGGVVLGKQLTILPWWHYGGISQGNRPFQALLGNSSPILVDKADNLENRPLSSTSDNLLGVAGEGPQKVVILPFKPSYQGGDNRPTSPKASTEVRSKVIHESTEGEGRGAGLRPSASLDHNLSLTAPVPPKSAHISHRREYSRIYYRRNRERILAYRRAWKKRHKYKDKSPKEPIIVHEQRG